MKFLNGSDAAWTLWLIFPPGIFTLLLRGFLEAKGITMERYRGFLSPELIREYVAAAGPGSEPYVHQQRAGEIMIVPAGASRSVLNQGGLTSHLAWPVITVDTLALALSSFHPSLDRMCVINALSSGFLSPPHLPLAYRGLSASAPRSLTRRESSWSWLCRSG